MDELAARLAGALASRLSSDAFTLYLYGSAVLGDFRPGWSDLDILCLTAAPLSSDTAGRLVLLRQELAAENEPASACSREASPPSPLFGTAGLPSRSTGVLPDSVWPTAIRSSPFPSSPCWMTASCCMERISVPA